MARKKKTLDPAELRRENLKKEMQKEVSEYPDAVDKALKAREKETGWKTVKVLDWKDKGEVLGIVRKVVAKRGTREVYFQDKFYVEK